MMIYQLEKKKDKKIIQNIKESQVIIISQNEKLNNRDNKEYLIVGFEQTNFLFFQLKDLLCFVKSIYLYQDCQVEFVEEKKLKL